MADAPAPTPGSQSSEFALTKVIVYAGFVAMLASAVLEGLQQAGMNFGWMPIALAIVGGLMSLLKAWGYTASRTQVKAAELAGKGAVEVAALVPLLQQAIALAKEAKAGSSTPGGFPTLTPPSEK